MFDVLCVTGRQLCDGDFLAQMERIVAARPAGVVLREKDLSPDAYLSLAREVAARCAAGRVPLILHSRPEAARALGVMQLQLPMSLLRGLSEAERREFAVLGASVHSVEEAREAEALGCSYLVFGHVFETDCKRGLPGRGVAALREVCGAVQVPVLAIGGVSAENVDVVRGAGAAGVCVMSSAMRTEDVGALLRGLRGDAGRE
ncbi:MAG: thiamine phosphate synthase [Clostridia bacterium]|nr:thiamine phosphate synthase [Clostridia bacterium]